MNLSGMFRLYRFSVITQKPHFLKEGEVFLGYIIWYSFGRFFIEGLRMDSLYAFSNIRVSQLLSLVMFVAAIVIDRS